MKNNKSDEEVAQNNILDDQNLMISQDLKKQNWVNKCEGQIESFNTEKLIVDESLPRETYGCEQRKQSVIVSIPIKHFMKNTDEVTIEELFLTMTTNRLKAIRVDNLKRARRLDGFSSKTSDNCAHDLTKPKLARMKQILTPSKLFCKERIENNDGLNQLAECALNISSKTNTVEKDHKNELFSKNYTSLNNSQAAVPLIGNNNNNPSTVSSCDKIQQPVIIVKPNITESTAFGSLQKNIDNLPNEPNEKCSARHNLPAVISLEREKYGIFKNKSDTLIKPANDKTTELKEKLYEKYDKGVQTDRIFIVDKEFHDLVEIIKFKYFENNNNNTSEVNKNNSSKLPRRRITPGEIIEVDSDDEPEIVMDTEIINSLLDYSKQYKFILKNLYEYLNKVDSNTKSTNENTDNKTHNNKVMKSVTKIMGDFLSDMIEKKLISVHKANEPNPCKGEKESPTAENKTTVAPLVSPKSKTVNDNPNTFNKVSVDWSSFQRQQQPQHPQKFPFPSYSIPPPYRFPYSQQSQQNMHSMVNQASMNRRIPPLQPWSQPNMPPPSIYDHRINTMNMLPRQVQNIPPPARTPNVSYHNDTAQVSTITTSNTTLTQNATLQQNYQSRDPRMRSASTLVTQQQYMAQQNWAQKQHNSIPTAEQYSQYDMHGPTPIQQQQQQQQQLQQTPQPYQTMDQEKVRQMEMKNNNWESQLSNYPNSNWSYALNQASNI